MRTLREIRQRLIRVEKDIERVQIERPDDAERKTALARLRDLERKLHQPNSSST